VSKKFIIIDNSWSLTPINITQRAFYIKKKPEKINIYIPLFAVPFGRRNLQFICNANKVILAWEDARKRRKCVEAEGLESKIIILFATS